MRISVLASGSGGNAVLVEERDTKVLIDCGVSLRQLQRRVHAVGATLEGLAAVLLTHEHTDHVQGVAVLRRHVAAPVIATPGTAEALAGLGGVEPGLVAGRSLRVGSLHFVPVATSHDAREPVGFVIESAAGRVALVTDTGELPGELTRTLAGCRALLLETNHDPDLLRYGRYPWPLKQRIASATGHLSNVQARGAIEALCHEGLEIVVAMHLSQENNRPELARREIERPLAGSAVRVAVASQFEPLVIEVGERRGRPGQGRLFDEDSVTARETRRA
ncbi:MAG: MBL fold metallo-hydrolase [Acidobacteriota bacterium]